MSIADIIKQLEQLLTHCEIMAEEHKNSDIWRRDCQALRAAIKLLTKKKAEENET